MSTKILPKVKKFDAESWDCTDTMRHWSIPNLVIIAKMADKQPLKIPYKHNIYDGTAQPAFITEARMEEIKEKHQSRPDDIFIATYVKSGTTWLQYLVYEIMGRPQGDYEQINLAVPWLEEESQELIDALASPRIMKTHDKWRWIPKGEGVKYIYCYRNPKDVAVSYFNHMKLFSGHYDYKGTFDEFVRDVFLAYNCSEQGYYFDHVAEWLAQRSNPNVLFLTFEDMVEDLNREVRRISSFLGVELQEDRLKEIVSSGLFSSMKNNQKVNYSWREGVSIEGKSTFIRKGKVGDWTNHLSQEHSDEIERLVEKHLLPLGATVRYVLTD